MAIFPLAPDHAGAVPASKPSGVVTQARSYSRSLEAWVLVLVAVGVTWRLVRYLLRFPIWGDEAFICLNLLDRDYLALIRPLRFVQVAPILFLWSELACLHLLSGSELALRLLPFLSGLASLALFWRLLRRVLEPQARALALGILAVSYYPVRHSCEVKPYAFDLLMALVLLVPAVSWLHQPRRSGWLVLLAALTPFALGASYPAVFVAGAVSLALFATVCRQRSWKAWALYAAYHAAMITSFLMVYRIAGTGQFQSTGGVHNDYWSEWFPPREPLALVEWLARVHTGNMMAYPVGAKDGGSALTFLLCLVGAWQLGRARRWDILLLCAAAFGLTFVAALLHRYPYGGSARVAQHLAPLICLLAGSGLAAMVSGVVRAGVSRQRCVLAVCVFLALVGISGLMHDLVKPYKTDADRQVRQIVADLVRQADPSDQIVVLDSTDEIGPTFQWYLRRQGDRISWNGHIDWESLDHAGQLWCLHLAHSPAENGDIETHIARARRRLVLTDHVVRHLQMGWSDETIERCEVLHWVGQ